jgi:hypothetical protein
MASSTKEQTVPELQNETRTRTELRAETSRSAFELFREYGRERPEIVALWCFGIGFVLGWKLKPW